MAQETERGREVRTRSEGSLIASRQLSELSITSPVWRVITHLCVYTVCILTATFLTKTSLISEEKAERHESEGGQDNAYLRLMTKALMRMIRRTTLPTTDTSSTVELAPSPIIGAGTVVK